MVEHVLCTITGDMVVTGACVGVDMFVAEWFAENRPAVAQKIIVPSDRSRVDPKFIRAMGDLANVEIIHMPVGSTYLARNMEIINNCAVLVGFPMYRESHGKSARSGTWQTIRKARIAGRKVVVHTLTSV
jgi:hypothetical protein